MINDLLNAELVIADLSLLNPNAFYEIGRAIKLALPSALVMTSTSRSEQPCRFSCAISFGCPPMRESARFTRVKATPQRWKLGSVAPSITSPIGAEIPRRVAVERQGRRPCAQFWIICLVGIHCVIRIAPRSQASENRATANPSLRSPAMSFLQSLEGRRTCRLWIQSHL
jgi:hypothetical protein